MSLSRIHAFLRKHHTHIDHYTYLEVKAARIAYLGVDEALRLEYEEAFASL